MRTSQALVLRAWIRFMIGYRSLSRTYTLIWRNKTDLEKQSLDDLFNSLKIYEAEVNSSFLASTSTQNITFVSSSNTDITNEPVSAAASGSTVSAKMHVSSLLNVVSLSNAVIYSFFDSQSSSSQLHNDDLKQIDADDLKEMNLKWQMAMLTMRARRFLQRTGRNLGSNGPTSIGFDMSKVECYNCHRKGHFARECRVFKQKRSQPTMLLWPFHLQVLLLTMRSDESLPPSPVYDRYQSGNGYHVVPPPYTGTFMPPKPDLVFNNAPNDVETDYPAFNIKLSPTKPDQDFSHTHRSSAPIIEDWVSDSEDESETKTPQNVPSFVQSTEQVKSPGPSVQHVKTSIPAATPKPASPKPTSNCKHRNRKAYFVCKIIPKSKLVTINVARPITDVVPKIKVTRPTQYKPIVTKPNSPTRRYINRSPSPKASNSPPRVTAVKALVVNASKGLIDSGCSRHMIGNMSYLSDFEELNDGYVAFRGNPKGGKISGKGKIRTGKLDFDDVYFVKGLKFNIFSVSQMRDKKNSVLFTDTECLVLSLEFKLPDKNQVLLRVPRENNMYNVNLKNIVPSRDLTCLFAKATLDESNLWHRRLGHINFKTMNKLVKGNLVRGLPTKVFENDNTCVACKKDKQHRASFTLDSPVI
uniref:Ribonuclease H-like domain-containing protein n=1 Tax=Tanacetum cinerariifolium TaxID=118510 RepID=A0A699H4L6_TANCI|nr:ribonuclease H-like domain-containing protein [Tanacetum cinerariifolium]